MFGRRGITFDARRDVKGTLDFCTLARNNVFVVLGEDLVGQLCITRIEIWKEFIENQIEFFVFAVGESHVSMV